MSENAVPIEEMTRAELLDNIRHCFTKARAAHAAYLAALARLSHLRNSFFPDLAALGLPEPCPYFAPPTTGLNPAVDIPPQLVSATSEFVWAARTRPG
ncbi:hypothetical protein [Kibdelosporangium aridum]|nr:hypothetical protein [Kibdelosporangium aridum]